ncbi:DUF7657 domain-containing protein [Paraburkholderia xenovorans]
MIKLLITACVALSSLIFVNAHAHTSVTPTAIAYLDRISLSADGESINLSGWAASGNLSNDKTTLIVTSGAKRLYTGKVRGALPRPDVVQVTGRRAWLNSGWELTIPMPAEHVDIRSIIVQVQFASGRAISSIQSNQEQPQAARTPTFVWVGLAIPLALLILAYIFANRACSSLSRFTNVHIPAQALPVAAVLVCFATFVTLGLSGSSLGIAEQAYPINGIVAINGAGHPEEIRSDEWRVLTPMSISQTRQTPPFPIVNPNLGPEGHNMLIPGMTSVPVWSISAIGRPATWGFFFLRLPQALAWYWWLPIAGCLLSLWACFTVLLLGRWQISFVLSLCFVMSPYAVAWSYWPAYLVMFGAAAFVIAVVLLRGCNGWLAIPLGVALAVSVSGFALTLYPPWQIPLAYLFALLLAGVIVRDLGSLRPRLLPMITLATGLALAVAIVLVWWAEAKDAVAAVVATIYPGQRSAVSGGTIDAGYLARGFTNFRTLRAALGNASNQSEVSSFIYLTVPALFAVVSTNGHRSKNRPIFFALVVFVAIAMWYQFVGFPVYLARWSLWGRSFPTRVDIATGLASFALMGVALVPSETTAAASSVRARHFGALGAALLWTAMISFSLHSAPEVIKNAVGHRGMIGIIAVCAITSWLLAAGFARLFLLVLVSLLLCSVYSFNPLTVFVESHSDDMQSTCGTGRTLVFGSNVPAMSLLASGCSVLNGVFYYPQVSLWHTLDPEGRQVSTYNRYQHLMFELADLHGSREAELSTPQGDIVQVKVDPRAYDFRRLPITRLLVPSGTAQGLDSNPSVRAQTSSPASSWVVFDVVRNSIQ